MKRLTLILSIALFFSGSVYSKGSVDENLYGTYAIKFESAMVQGETLSCNLRYNALIQSDIYEVGAEYVVVGNIGLGTNNEKNNILVSLKVVNNQVSLKKPKNKPIPKKPYFAYLMLPNGINNAKGFIKSMNSDTPAGLFSVYNFNEESMSILTGMLEKETISIAFNLQRDGMDIIVPLDLTVASVNDKTGRVRSEKMTEEFSKCSAKLLKEVLNNVK